MVTKRILILAPYPFNEAPSQRFRFEQYLNFLNENGISYDFKPFLSQKTWKSLYASGKTSQKSLGVFMSFLRRWLLIFQLRNYHFIFIHREAAHIGPPIFEWIIAKIWRKKIIYDSKEMFLGHREQKKPTNVDVVNITQTENTKLFKKTAKAELKKYDSVDLLLSRVV